MLYVHINQFKVIERYMEGEQFKWSLLDPEDKKVILDMIVKGIAVRGLTHAYLTTPVESLYRQNRIAVDNTRLTKTRQNRFGRKYGSI